jgi:predicted nucleic acid-binding protein
MRYDLDASVALKWVLAETNSDKAERLRDDFRAGVHELIVPDIFPSEVANALTRAERKKQIAVGEAVILLADVMTTLPRLFSAVPYLITRATTLSSAESHKYYDCLYLALAEREGCEFVTADDTLVNKFGATYPYVKALSTFP